jgi:hypothetical protein
LPLVQLFDGLLVQFHVSLPSLSAALGGILGTPVAPAPAALVRLAVTVGPERLAVGAATVVVVCPVGAGAGMEWGHRCHGARLGTARASPS